MRGVSAIAAGPYSDAIPHQTFMIFQAMFAIITPALVIGGVAGRIKFSALVIFIVLWSTLLYAPLAHWVWGNGDGWGAMDFAGGAVIHINAGVAALAAALILGRRLHFGTEPMEPHNIPFVVLGVGLLWFGWFGFNGGSALMSGGSATNAIVVTNTAAAMAAMIWVACDWLFSGKPTVVGAATGAVAGLGAITPAAGFVGPMPAIIIGVVAGLVCYGASRLRNKIRLDDSLDVLAVHGIGGTWGILATGVFVGVGFMTISDLALPGIDRPGGTDFATVSNHRGHLGVVIYRDCGDIACDKVHHWITGIGRGGRARTGLLSAWRRGVSGLA